jgi:hydroxymethylglutaryl-CoA reductase
MSDPQPGSSRIPGFYKLSLDRRLEVLEAVAGQPVDVATRQALQGVDHDLLDRFVENAIGGFSLPFGVAVNVQVDGRDVLVPMAVEESSVVAAASNMARLARNTGGFQTEVVEDLMIGQIQILDLDDVTEAAAKIEARTAEIAALANAKDSKLVELGGGCVGIETRIFTAEETGSGDVLVVHLLVNTLDAMGANVVNTMAESLAPWLEHLTGGRVGLRILSNLADRRRYVARCRIRHQDLSVGDLDGREVCRRIEEAAAFAHYDRYRAATHNKGIMNGVDPVVIATGNDWRAIEAGAHAWAARDGRYRSLSKWTVDEHGDLHGELELPLQLGIVGGVTRLHPLARWSLQLMGIERGADLARIVVSVGLAQNLGALRALATEGIQKGHMRLHKQNQELAARLEAGS